MSELPLFDWRPTTAEIIPFPARCRRGFIEKHARIIAGLSAPASEKHIRHQLKVQHETMLRRGIKTDVAKREIETLEAAIRDFVCRLVFARRG